jgi:NhaP-type Na+/H+ or K+/H+ antiporter
MAETILAMGAVYFLAHLLAITFDRTGLPDVLVLMVIGIIAGPVLHWITPESFGSAGHVLTTIALAVILFESGTTLDLREIGRSARSTVQVTLSTVFVTIGLVAVGAHFALDLPWMSAFLIGTIVSGTSPAVVIPMVKSLKVRERASTLLILESALADVASIVLTFALVQAAQQGEVRLGLMVGQTVSSLVFAVAIGIAGGVGWLLVWERVRQLPSTIFTTLAGAFILYGAAELLGFAGAIAVMAFGVTLTNHQHFGLAKFLSGRPLTGVTPTESDFYLEIVFLLKTFFFVYLGISMQADSPALVGIAVALTTLVYLGRFVIAARLAPTAATRREATIIAIMVPKGLAAAVLAGLPLEAGLPNGELIQSVVYGIVLVSIVFTAVLVAVREKVPMRPFFGALMRRFPTATSDTTPGGTPLTGIPTVSS